MEAPQNPLHLSIILIFPVLLLLCTCGYPQYDAPEDPVFSWMEGTWASVPARFYETWENEAPGRWKGSGFLIGEAGDTTVTETLKITADRHGTTYAVIVPEQNDGQEICFSLTSATGDTFTFSNPDHDFPRQIMYIRLPDTRMKVLLSGDTASEPVEINFIKQPNQIHD